MNQPSLDLLMKKVDSRYTLVVIAAKRARELTADGEEENTLPSKPVSMALQEIAAGKIKYRRVKNNPK
ncbi:DNA-directed RNA polymerase subunit omega [Desulfotomaculum copahuensis]|nr:DNA-directed RNA polymerase subunit omega [Desulfotomaculum copahuensis]